MKAALSTDVSTKVKVIMIDGSPAHRALKTRMSKKLPISVSKVYGTYTGFIPSFLVTKCYLLSCFRIVLVHLNYPLSLYFDYFVAEGQ